MVIVEFISSNQPYPGAKHYFLGKTLPDVLRATQNGRQYGIALFTSHREIDEQEARSLRLDLEEGEQALKTGAESFLLKAYP